VKLALKFTGGVRVCDWASYALLRDNVQHFLERGAGQERFSALHAFEKAVDVGDERIDASRLRGEVLRAWSALRRKTCAEAAVSARTLAIMTNSPETPDASETLSARSAACDLPLSVAPETPIVHAANAFVSAVLALTATARVGDWLEVRRLGEPPRFARLADAPSARSDT